MAKNFIMPIIYALIWKFNTVNPEFSRCQNEDFGLIFSGLNHNKTFHL